MTKQTQTEKEIKKVLESRIQAYQNKDVDKVIQYYAETPDLVFVGWGKEPL